MSKWNEDYLNENDESHWQNGIFSSMQLQEIQEASQVVEQNSSNSSSDITNKMAESSVTEHVAPEEEDNAEANGS
jgi:galactose-1-phosphate uridylyltransferase